MRAQGIGGVANVSDDTEAMLGDPGIDLYLDDED